MAACQQPSSLFQSGVSPLCPGGFRQDAFWTRIAAKQPQVSPPPAGVTHAALQWKGGVFQDRLATWNQRDLADLAGLLAKLNES